MSYQTDQSDAIETALSRDRRRSLSSSRMEGLKRFLLNDSFAFTKIVAKHDDLIEEYHAPVSYAFTHLTDQFIRTLNDPRYDSFVTDHIRQQLRGRGIDWNAPSGRDRVDELLDILDVRVFRGWYKSSVCTHGGGAFIATKDPNRTTWLVSNSDPNAWAFADQIGKTVLSGIYQDLFPERRPAGNINEQITGSRITLGGRTISHPQTNIEADGYLTKRISAHFDTFIIDDLVVKENSTASYMPAIKQWLAGLPPFEMVSKRTWRRHVGTIWAPNSDYEFMVKGAMGADCLSIFVPIEVYSDGYPTNMLTRGKPTCPKLFSIPKIQKLQNKILNDDKEGPVSWRRNYWLDATDGSDAIFPTHVIEDRERQYVRIEWDDPRFEKPRPDLKKAGQFLVSRYVRDDEGKIVLDKDGARKRITLDPWRQMDRVMIIDPAWSENGDNWGVVIEGWDSEGYRADLDALSGLDGQEGWLNAAAALDVIYKPRVIGFDGAAYQDAAVQNLMRYDPRLRKLRSRMVKVPHNNQSKPYRIKQGVAEPLKMYKILMHPGKAGILIREEMRQYKGDKNFSPALLDAKAMAPAVARRRVSDERQKSRTEEIKRRQAEYDRQIDPYTGVHRAA